MEEKKKKKKEGEKDNKKKKFKSLLRKQESEEAREEERKKKRNNKTGEGRHNINTNTKKYQPIFWLSWQNLAEETENGDSRRQDFAFKKFSLLSNRKSEFLQSLSPSFPDAPSRSFLRETLLFLVMSSGLLYLRWIRC